MRRHTGMGKMGSRIIRFFSNLRLVSKVLLPVSLLGTLAVIITLFSMLNMRGIDRDYRDLLGSDAAASILIGDALLDLSDAGRLVAKDCIALSCAYGLVEIGRPAVPALLDLLQRGPARARKLAAFALGEIDGTGPEVLDALVAAAGDADAHLRIAAIEALGLKPADDAAVTALARGLDDADEEVRFDAVLGLARMGQGAAAAVPALARVLTRDPNRYVRGYAVEALSRIGDDAAHRALLPYLKLSRWCPMTTSASIF